MNETDGRGAGGDVVINEVERGATPAELYGLLEQLRPDLAPQLFRELTTTGYDQGLRFIVAVDAGGTSVAAAGYRVLSTTRGRILYVDDLVTASAVRSRGFAAVLMADLRRRAHSAGCDRLELDSGVTNTQAHRFYLRERLDIGAFHFGVPVGS